MHDTLPKTLPVLTLVAMDALVISCLNGGRPIPMDCFREILVVLLAGECQPCRAMATSPYIQ